MKMGVERNGRIGCSGLVGNERWRNTVDRMIIIIGYGSIGGDRKNWQMRAGGGGVLSSALNCS